MSALDIHLFSRVAGFQLSLEDIERAIQWQRLHGYNCAMAKWIVRLHGHTKPMEFEFVKSKEVEGDFTVFRDAEGGEIASVRTARIDSAEAVKTQKPALADRTPEELEVLHKLVTQAERLGFTVSLTDKKASPE